MFYGPVLSLFRRSMVTLLFLPGTGDLIISALPVRLKEFPVPLSAH